MKFCAFLRGVNVKGTSMKMAEVCQVFLGTGMANVSSVLASGNIIFSSDGKASELEDILEKAMSEHFEYEAIIFIKNESEVAEIVSANPFQKMDTLHVYSFIGVPRVEQVLREEFDNADKSENEKAAVINNNFYWQVAKGNTLGSSFGGVLGKKNLKDKMTSRNINTLEKILKKF